jgi:hypothetical protein
LWGIVNSAIGIWFLSSVVLGIFGFVYNNWYVVERENQRTAQRLDAEIASRIACFDLMQTMWEQVYTERKKENGKSTDLPFEPSELVMALERPSTVDYPVNVFPEYQNRSLRSLLWELVRVVPDQEKEDVRRAYRQSLELQRIYLQDLYVRNKLPNQPTVGIVSQIDAARRIGFATRQFVSVFNLERWGSPFKERVQEYREDEERWRKDRENKATAGGPNSK